MVIHDVEEALATYIQVLSDSADQTHRAEDRPVYERHLAAAARMFVALRRDPTLQELKAIVAHERHGYGWFYLSDEAGAQAEAAFTRFAAFVDRV